MDIKIKLRSKQWPVKIKTNALPIYHTLARHYSLEDLQTFDDNMVPLHLSSILCSCHK